MTVVRESGSGTFKGGIAECEMVSEGGVEGLFCGFVVEKTL